MGGCAGGEQQGHSSRKSNLHIAKDQSLEHIYDSRYTEIVHPPIPSKDAPSGWRDRLFALRNIPPLLRMVWATSPSLAIATVLLRLVDSLLPVATLWVAKLIVDATVGIVSGKAADAGHIWTLVAIEAGLAVLADLIGRATVLCDSLLGDRFTNHMSLRMMEHANTLDLVSFEDPVFYDKLERARRQTDGTPGNGGVPRRHVPATRHTSDNVGGHRVFLAVAPPLLIMALLPAFLGETKFAMLSYSLLYRWTPERRQLDYLRMLGASNASAKEVRIFGLGDFSGGTRPAIFSTGSTTRTADSRSAGRDWERF